MELCIFLFLDLARCKWFLQETRPVFNKTQAPNPCALLQLAVRDAENKEEVFILDLLSLSAELSSPTLSTVFLSDDVLKLGLGFHLDLQV